MDVINCLGGLSKLKAKLQEVAVRIRKDDIQNIGIIVDADGEGIDNRISLINKELQDICSDINITEECKFFYSDELSVNIACVINNIDGYGELETVLKKIKKNNSLYADCLESWRKCVESTGEKVSQKNFDKLWVWNDP